MQNLALSRDGKCLSTIYINARNKLLWKCKFGHQWEAVPYAIKAGGWCPQCHIYISEEICRIYMEAIFNFPFPKIRPDWLLSPLQCPMELDGYCKELNIA